jgi:hypothetical protein
MGWCHAYVELLQRHRLHELAMVVAHLSDCAQVQALNQVRLLLMRRARTASGTATQCTRTNDLFHEQERTYMHTKRVCPHCAEALPAMGAGGCVSPFVCCVFENR